MKHQPLPEVAAAWVVLVAGSLVALPLVWQGLRHLACVVLL